jgi:hypothetical protein
MLAAVEKGLVNKILECVPRHAIYQAGAFQVSRAAGIVPWIRHDPKYVGSCKSYMGK